MKCSKILRGSDIRKCNAVVDLVCSFFPFLIMRCDSIRFSMIAGLAMYVSRLLRWPLWCFRR